MRLSSPEFAPPWAAATGSQAHEQAFHRLFPGRHAVTALVLVEPIKHIFAKTQPGTVGIILLHHFLPDGYRQSEGGFLVPGNLRHLQGTVIGS